MKNSSMIFMAIIGFSVGLLAQDQPDKNSIEQQQQAEQSMQHNQETDSNYLESFVHKGKDIADSATQILVPVWKKIGSNLKDGIDQVPTLFKSMAHEIEAKFFEYKDKVQAKIEDLQKDKKAVTIGNEITPEDEGAKKIQSVDTSVISDQKLQQDILKNIKPLPSFIDLRTDAAKIECMKSEAKKAMNQGFLGFGNWMDIDTMIATIEEIQGKKIDATEKQKIIAQYNDDILKLYNRAYPATINLTCAMVGVGITAISIVAYIAYQYVYAAKKDADHKEKSTQK